MKIDILFSGSSGNCTLVRDGATEILIDCGKSRRAVSCALADLGTSLEKISAIFITHEHTDHTSALDAVCAKYRIPVHVTRASAGKLMKFDSVASCAVCHDTEFAVRVGSLAVSSFPLPHDSAECVGYVVRSDGGDVFGTATDMGHITERALEELSGCREVMVEANHDPEMLAEGSYPPVLKRRIASPRGHLSNASCAELVCALARRGVEAFALAHLSPENNLPDLAYGDIRAALDAEGFSGCALVVADRHFTVSLPERAKETL